MLLVVVALLLLLQCHSVPLTAAPTHQTIIPLPDWKNPVNEALTAEIQARVAALAADLPVEQKARLLDMYAGSNILTSGAVDEKKIRAFSAGYGLGSVHDFYPPSAEYTNHVQRIIFNDTTTNIPGHTSFPGPLGLAATFNPGLVESIGHIIGQEARAYGVRMCLSPVLGAAREPRWGRVEETMGEDTYLIATLARAYVYGLQGRTLSNNTVIAEPKHYAAHSIPEGGRNTAVSHVGLRELEDTFLPQFHAAVSAGALSMMSAYSEADGVPCSASDYLLTQKLRDEFGFQGFVLSDLGAVSMLYSIHHIAASPAEAIIKYLIAGGNSQFYDFGHDVWQAAIVNGINNGTLPMDVLNARVADVLRIRELLQLNEQPFTDPDLVRTQVDTPEARRLALQAAQEGAVLLKNDAVYVGTKKMKLLPLSPAFTSIAVIGLLADQINTGDYAGPFNQVNDRQDITLLHALTLNSTAQILYDPGVNVFDQQTYLPITKQHFPNGLDVQFWNNTAMNGSAVVTRKDSEIDYAWYHYGFAREYPSPMFSARWNGTLTFPVTMADASLSIDADEHGAVRVTLAGQVVVDQLNDTGECRPCTFSWSMTQGTSVSIVIDYYQTGSDNSLSLNWDVIGSSSSAAIARAVSIAAKADVAIVAVGDNTASSGEGHDRVDIRLSGMQSQLISAIATQISTPMVVLMFSGRPPAIPEIAGNQQVGAIIEAYTPGQAQGTALTQLLYGQVSFGGRLPMTYPKSVGQAPLFYNYKPSAQRSGYVDSDHNPLFPFGFGLSYSTFSYSALSITPSQVPTNGIVTVTFIVKNNGPYDGDEVAQLYLTDVVSSTTVPVRQLRGFARVHLANGANTTVTLYLNVSHDCALVDESVHWVVEPGVFNVAIGGNSLDQRLTGSFTVVDARMEKQQYYTQEQQKEINQRMEKERLERVQQREKREQRIE